MSGVSGAIQGYMAVAVVDDGHQVVTAAGIAEDTEHHSFISMLEQVEKI